MTECIHAPPIPRDILCTLETCVCMCACMCVWMDGWMQGLFVMLGQFCSFVFVALCSSVLSHSPSVPDLYYSSYLLEVRVCLSLYVWCYAVVVFCHSKSVVRTQFLFRAQDHNMTNGDFAFFTFRPARHSGTDRPWTGYFEVSEDLTRRLRALYAVKQVRPYTGHTSTVTFRRELKTFLFRQSYPSVLL